MSGYEQMVRDRDRKAGLQCQYEHVPKPELVEEVLCEFPCPLCGEWLCPVATVGRKSGHQSTQHDVRCGCLEKCATDEDRTALICEWEAKVGECLAADRPKASEARVYGARAYGIYDGSNLL